MGDKFDGADTRAGLRTGAHSVIPLLATPDELTTQLTLDSKVLAEQFYFFTVVIMWLIHAGFMAYEAGVARRKNVMSTALKNILTIAVVTPDVLLRRLVDLRLHGARLRPDRPERRRTWSAARSTSRPSASRRSPGATTWGRTCTDNITGVFWAAFLLFSWTTGSIMSGALIERVRLCGLPAPDDVPRLRRLDPRRRLGLERRRLARDRVRLPRLDRLGGGARRGRRVHARACCSSSARASASTRATGRRAAFLPHNLHLTLLGLMLIFTGFYAFYAACLVIQSTVLPGLGQHLPVADDAVGDHVRDHDRVRRRLHGRLLREQRRPVLDALGRPRRRDRRVRGRRRLPPVARLPALDA